MMQAARWKSAVAVTVLALSSLAVYAGGGDEMVENPMYKYWANHKPGASATRLEKTAFSGAAEKSQVPDGIDEKEVTYKLLSVSPTNVVVEVVVKERGFLGTIESSPTKQSYPSKIKKSHLKAGLHDVDVKLGKDTIVVLGKKLDCTTASGMEKKEGTEIDHKMWLSEQIPGGIVKHTRVTKVDGKVYADTTITLESFTAGK
jgi:hypothetical protein